MAFAGGVLWIAGWVTMAGGCMGHGLQLLACFEWHVRFIGMPTGLVHSSDRHTSMHVRTERNTDHLCVIEHELISLLLFDVVVRVPLCRVMCECLVPLQRLCLYHKVGIDYGTRAAAASRCTVHVPRVSNDKHPAHGTRGPRGQPASLKRSG
eukprot:4245202-Prymnesium_polylepis.1